MSKPNISPTFRPLYQQIKILLTQSLVSGEWQPGEMIPSEIELAHRFKVSQGTVRKAIDELAAENILVRKQGKGTFVATHTEERSQYRFMRIAGSNGEIELPGSQLVECRRGKASAEIAKLLELRNGSLLVILRRVLSLPSRPLILDDIYLPAALFKGLTAAKVNEYHGGMYSFFETQYGVRMIRADERLRAVATDASTAALLDVDVGYPLLRIDRVAYTYGDRPVEFRRSLVNTDQHYYTNELE